MTHPGQLEWFGCSTFRLTLDGVVIFLDSYLDRAATAAPTGLAAAEVDRADWILIGHSHFDHLYGADTIALNTGATIVGSYETARVMSALGVPDSQLLRVAGGELLRLADHISVRVLPALHSCVWTHRAAPGVSESCHGSEGTTYQDQLAAMEGLFAWVGTLGSEVLEHLTLTATGAHGDGGTLTYVLEHPQGSILFQDSAGGWSQLFDSLEPKPDLAILAAGGRPNHNGEPWQGSMLDYLAMEVEALSPGAMALCHHDDFLPGFSAPVDVDLVEERLVSIATATRLLRMDLGRAYPIFEDGQIALLS